MISLIIPVFNEEKNIPGALFCLKEYLGKIDEDFQLIMVDDGSIDSTYKKVEAGRSEFKDFDIISYPKNKGRGFAIRKALGLLKGDKVFYMDLDMPLNVNFRILPTMIDELDTTDIVIASRFHPHSKVRRKALRGLISAVYRFLVRSFFPVLDVSDTDVGLKGFKREVFDRLARDSKFNRWSWDLEAIVLAREKKFNIKEIPIEWEEKGSSKVRIFKDSLEQLFGLIRNRFKI